VQDEVLAVEPIDGSYQVRCRERVLRSGQVVLATGSPPVLPRLHAADSDPTDAGTAVIDGLVDDPFATMPGAVQRVRAAVRRSAGRYRPHVVLIGGNAGTMDMLYQLNDADVPELRQAVFTVLAPQGELPARVDDTAPVEVDFEPERLRALEDGSDVAAAAVYEAALADIARGRRAGLSAADTLRPISQAVGRLLPRLSAAEAVEFAGRWGTELGRHSAGVRELDLPAAAVVNCGGPAKELARSGAPLLSQLIDSGVCRATPSGGGIAVDPLLAAAPGLYVMGPLLAGNLVHGAPLWHMEHCGRISTFGTAFGRELARDLLPG
jgi:uncharacterized NAD(P)/FAD-binding protein YdhS